MVGLGGLEPPTSPLSGVHSNQLSYRPLVGISNSIEHRSLKTKQASGQTQFCVRFSLRATNRMVPGYSRKEVIQPQVLLRLPCYDFTPVADSTVSGSYFSFPISGEINSHGVTGGEYKTRERIHRSLADLRLLVIPASCSRVAENNPN
jgi:hypothetical protein